MANTSALKKTFDAMAIIAVLNVFGVGGLLGYLVFSGIIDAEKMKRIVDVVRNEDAMMAETEEEGDSPEADVEVAAVPMAGEFVSQVDLEIMRREAERIKEELRQRLALNDSILLRVQTERESFREERNAAAAKDQSDTEMREKDGFRKQIAIIEGLKPKNAADYLLSFEDIGDAARTLSAMETRRARKIVEAAKGPEQVEKMKEIVRRLRKLSPSKLDDKR